MTKPKTWYRYEKGNKADKNMTICFSQLQNDRNGVFSSKGLTTPVDSPSLFTVMENSHKKIHDPLQGIVTETPEKKHEIPNLQHKTVSPTDSHYSWGNKGASPLSENHDSPRGDLRLESQDSWDGDGAIPENHDSPRGDLRLESQDSWDGDGAIAKRSTPTGMGSSNKPTIRQAVTGIGDAMNTFVRATSTTVGNTINNVKKSLGDSLKQLGINQDAGFKKRKTKRRKLKIKRKLKKSYKKKKVRRRKNKTRRKMNKRRNKSRRHN